MSYNVPHYCPDWDYMDIRPGDPEMEVCVCDLKSPRTAKDPTISVYEFQDVST